MKADERRPTSVIHECRRCDELWEMVVALVDEKVVCDILGLMRDLREREGKSTRFRCCAPHCRVGAISPA
jgi:hypothetical protein